MKRLLLDFIVFFMAAALLAGGWFALYALRPAEIAGQQTVIIAKGSSPRKITSILAEHNLVADDIRFVILARMLDVSGKLRAGEYLIKGSPSPVQLLGILHKGETVQHQITIPEGKTMAEIAAIFAHDHWVKQEAFLALCTDKKYISGLGFSVDSLEGYLFPDTYALVRGQGGADAVIRMLSGRFKTLWQEVGATTHPDFNRHEILTLASIVEKETGAARERPLITRVFLNRLDRGMRLQTDPTVIYGIAGFNGNLTRVDLKNPHPYNTYVHPGLPPGPICNPGRAAIEAVLTPAKSKALYFVSKNDGSHYFSRTLKEHNRAVRKYQKR